MIKTFSLLSVAFAGIFMASSAAAQGAPADIRMALMECSAQGAGDNAKIEACMTARGFRKQAEVKPGPGSTTAKPAGAPAQPAGAPR